MQDVIAETDRLVLRLWRPEEAPRLLDLLGRPEVARWLGGEGEVVLLRDLDEARQRIRAYEQRSLASPLGVWAVVPKEPEAGAGTPAGSALLLELPDGTGEVEIGWHLHPDSHGRGYATESARLLLDRGFRNGLPEVYAVTHLDNGPSQAVTARLGMRDLGEVERWYPGRSRLFRTTRQEWAAQRSGA